MRSPRRFSAFFKVSEYFGAGSTREVLSLGSCPAIVSRTNATSYALLRHRTDGIKGGNQRDQAIARDTSIGGLKTCDATKARRHADRAASVLAEGKGSQPRRDGRGRSTARAAGDVVQVPWIAGGEEARVLGGGTHAELVHVVLAEQDGACRLQFFDRGRVVERFVILQDFGGAGCVDAACGDGVLGGVGDACKRS